MQVAIVVCGFAHSPQLASHIAEAWEAAAPGVQVTARGVPDAGASLPAALTQVRPGQAQQDGELTWLAGGGVVVDLTRAVQLRPELSAGAAMAAALGRVAGEDQVIVSAGAMAPTDGGAELWSYLKGGGVAPAHAVVAYTHAHPFAGPTGLAAQLAHHAQAGGGVGNLGAGPGQGPAMSGHHAEVAAQLSRAAQQMEREARRRDLLGSTRLSLQPGTGAAGGAALALAAWGYRLQDADAVLGEAAGVAAAAQRADLVVAVVPEPSWERLLQGACHQAISVAAARAIPVVAVGGVEGLSRREWAEAGIAGLYVEPALAGANPTVPASRVRRLVSTWSPAR